MLERRSGGDLPASSLPPSPVESVATRYGVVRVVATLEAIFTSSSTNIENKKKKGIISQPGDGSPESAVDNDVQLHAPIVQTRNNKNYSCFLLLSVAFQLD